MIIYLTFIDPTKNFENGWPNPNNVDQISTVLTSQKKNCPNHQGVAMLHWSWHRQCLPPAPQSSTSSSCSSVRPLVGWPQPKLLGYWSIQQHPAASSPSFLNSSPFPLSRRCHFFTMISHHSIAVWITWSLCYLIILRTNVLFRSQ